MFIALTKSLITSAALAAATLAGVTVGGAHPAGAAAAGLPLGCVKTATEVACTYEYNRGVPEQVFYVPVGISTVWATAIGGAGGSTAHASGGAGGWATQLVDVSHLRVLFVEVGGSARTSTRCPTHACEGGANGGGSANDGGGGGGESDVRSVSISDAVHTLGSRLVVGAGGGGAGRSDWNLFQVDGGAAGQNGADGGHASMGGEAATLTSAGAGGRPNGGPGTLGQGGGPVLGRWGYTGGGGGGGGLYGGGGGADNPNGSPGQDGGGGGGGSSLGAVGMTGIAPMGTTPSVTIRYELAPFGLVHQIGSGLCASPDAAGIEMALAPCSNGLDAFRQALSAIVDPTTGARQLYSPMLHTCLTERAQTQGAAVILAACKPGAKSQLWTLEVNQFNGWSLTNMADNRYLDTANGGIQAGTPLVVGTFDGSSTQEWTAPLR